MTIAPERPEAQTEEANAFNKAIVQILSPALLADLLHVAELVDHRVNPNDPNLIRIEVFNHRLYPKGQFSANRQHVMEIVNWVNKALHYQFRGSSGDVMQRIAIWWFTHNVAIKFDDQYDDQPRTPYDCLCQLHELSPRVTDVPGQLRQAVTHI